MDGQMNIFDFPEYLPDEKLIEGHCNTCCWANKNNKCNKLIYDYDKADRLKHEAGNCDDWKPNTLLFKCCHTCDYCNDFEYQGEDIKHPVDEPNIYCTHSEGSLNRYCRWPQHVQPNFGVGLYHRQHEYDLCDRWKLDRVWKDRCKEL